MLEIDAKILAPMLAQHHQQSRIQDVASGVLEDDNIDNMLKVEPISLTPPVTAVLLAGLREVYFPKPGWKCIHHPAAPNCLRDILGRAAAEGKKKDRTDDDKSTQRQISILPAPK